MHTFRRVIPAHTTALRSAEVDAGHRHGTPVSATVRISGWGRNVSSAARLVTPVAGEDVARLVQRARDRGVIARGMGRSYGDAALCAGGTVLDMSHRNRILEFDPGKGTLIAEAGTTLSAVLAQTLPRGWLPPVLPGTAQVSLGGAVASDVHGKNHVSAGSFGQHVLWLDLLGADLSVTRLSPVHHPHEFWATVGGMGLTGVILAVALQLRPASATMRRRAQRYTTFHAVLQAMNAAAAGQEHDPGLHAIAWIDALAPGYSLGRGIVQTAHLLERGATEQAVPHHDEQHGSGRERPARTVPSLPGPGLISAAALRAANALRWQGARSPGWTEGSVRSTLQPLDRIEMWPAAFGRAGLVQCQVAVPLDGAGVLDQILILLGARRVPPALVTLKRFGAASPAPLSFPMPGWTMAMDFPARWPALQAALDQVEAMAITTGGRVYLTKDSRTTAADMARMYPRLEEWRAVRTAMDPEGVFSSDLGRRLGLVSARPA